MKTNLKFYYVVYFVDLLKIVGYSTHTGRMLKGLSVYIVFNNILGNIVINRLIKTLPYNCIYSFNQSPTLSSILYTGIMTKLQLLK